MTEPKQRLKKKGAAELWRAQNQVQEFAADVDIQAEIAEANIPQVSRPAPAPAVSPQAQRMRDEMSSYSGLKTSEELQLEKEPIRVRETGFWMWKRVIVPPNVYVVHTRIGRKDPVTIGLGISFNYNPFTDAYLVVPAAMQTIGVIANCISQEKQGINVLAYVQWQIEDFSIAYRKLDFSDQYDPLGIVNAQLREQAEAAIKDKIATMSVEEVLTDKEPVIEELTTRLKAVSEGRAQGEGTAEDGLGIKIVTVQIKEALVSSLRLWENLQAPFRNEKESASRISRLNMQEEIRQRELEVRRESETSEAETMVEIERIKQSKETEALELRLGEESSRFTRQQETEREKIQLEEETTVTRRESEARLAAQQAQAEQERILEQARLDSDLSAQQKTLQVEQELSELTEQARIEIARLQATQERIERETTMKTLQSQLDQLIQQQTDELQALRQEAAITRQRETTLADLQLQEEQNRVKVGLMEREAEVERLHQEIRNLINERDLANRLIELLPEIASEMPEIQELRVLQTGDSSFDTLAAFIAQIRTLAQSLGIPLERQADETDD